MGLLKFYFLIFSKFFNIFCNIVFILSSFNRTATKKTIKFCPIYYLLSSAGNTTVKRKWRYMENIVTVCLSLHNAI